MHKLYSEEELKLALALTRVACNSSGLLVQAHPLIAELTGDLFTAKFYPVESRLLGVGGAMQWTLEWSDPEAVNGWGNRLYAEGMRQVTVAHRKVTGLPSEYANFSMRDVYSAQLYPERLVLVVPGKPYVNRAARAEAAGIPPIVAATYKQFGAVQAAGQPGGTVHRCVAKVATRPTGGEWGIHQREFYATYDTATEQQLADHARANGLLRDGEQLLEVRGYQLAAPQL